MRGALALLLLVAARPAGACHHAICFLADGSSSSSTNDWIDKHAGTALLTVTLTAGELLADTPILLGDAVRAVGGWRKPHWFAMTETVVGAIELTATGALLIATYTGDAGDGADPYAGRGVVTTLLVIDGVLAAVKLGLGVRGLRRESRPDAPRWSLVPSGAGLYAVGRF